MSFFFFVCVLLCCSMFLSLSLSLSISWCFFSMAANYPVCLSVATRRHHFYMAFLILSTIARAAQRKSKLIIFFPGSIMLSEPSAAYSILNEYELFFLVVFLFRIFPCLSVTPHTHTYISIWKRKRKKKISLWWFIKWMWSAQRCFCIYIIYMYLYLQREEMVRGCVWFVEVGRHRERKKREKKK